MAQHGSGQSSEDKAARMGPEMSKASDQPAPGGQADSGGEKAGVQGDKKPHLSDQPSGERAPGDGSVTWSEIATGPDGLPLGTDAKSGPGSDGPV
jgi:hypothetical protein